ncbi:RHS repeat-associated core domain-containing protein [Variovorax sp. ZT5P49]|uniref:RHS repeat-associated core domain-containing protein n=1 Tax=Variovorax sp. ZT5P49 TaxID=3443733 RepID=UPI003F468563
MSAWRRGMRAFGVGAILWVQAASGQAQFIDANCRQFIATGNMNCELSPASFSGWAYSTGYATGATEDEAIQNTLSAYFGSSSSVCNVAYFTDAQTVSVYDGFVNSNQAIGTKRKLSFQWGTLSNGVCSGVQVGAIFTITGIRTADCKTGWSKYWDSPHASNFCGIYSAPLPAEPSSALSCRAPQANVGMTGLADGEAFGNPLVPATAEKLQSEADFVDGGPAPLSFVRTYRSNWANSSAISHDATSLGTAWSHNHATRLNAVTGTISLVTLTTGEGYVRFFKRASDGVSWQATNSVDTLVATASGGWTYRRADDDATFNFNAAGLLQTLVARNGWTTTYLYNSAGQLASVSNGLGRTLTFAYDAAGQLQSLTTPDGRTVSYSYDASGRLVTVTAPDATARTYLYENTSFSQALTGITDEVGVRFATFAYNSLGQATSSEHAGSVALYQVSYPSSTTAKVTDPLGTMRSYTFSTVANRLNIVSASSPAATDVRDAVSRTVDSNGLVTAESDFKYVPTRSVTWDTARRLPLTVIRAPGATEAQSVAIQWHATLALPVLVTESGRTTAWTYDANGNALSQTITDTSSTSSSARTWQWTYNAQGLVATETAPNGAAISYTYDALGNLIRTANALGQTSSYAYDSANRLVSTSAPNGLVTAYTYDARDRLSTYTVGGQQTTTLSYNVTGTLATLSLPTGLAFSYAYDAAHRLTGWSNNRGESGSFTLDSMGNRTAEQIRDGAGNVAWTSVRAINALNRLSARTDGPNQASAFGYNNNGDLVTETNGLSQSTQYSLDVLRRVTSIANAASASAKLAYNAQDAVTAVSDFKGVATTYARDALGNATSETSADVGTASTQYDNLGLPSQITDALGQATTITRDALGRPTGLVFADGKTTTLRYDLTANSKGYLSEIVDRSGTTEYTRDTFGRITLKKQTLINGSVQQVSYAYNPNGTLASIGYPNGAVLSHLYDATGRLTGLNLNGNALVSGIAWNPLGQPTAWTWAFSSPATSARRSYDTAGRMTATDFSSYVYDAAGRIISLTQSLYQPGDSDATQSTIASTSVTWSGGYNSVGRLVSFNATGNTASFGYDANGNRTSSIRVASGQSTSRTYTVGSGVNRLTGFTQSINSATSTSVTYAYNANGDLVSDGLRTYGYDAEGRLSNATTGATDVSPTTRYAHNALGQRVFKTEPLYPATQGDENDSGFMASLIAFFRQLWSPTTATAEQLGYAYVYDEQGTLIAEVGSGGTNSAGEAQYIYLPTAGGPMPIAAVINGTTYAVHSDHLNTPRKLTDASGQAAWQWSYSAFGEDKPTLAKYRFANLDVTPSPGTTSISEVKFNLRYPGQYADEESGLFYNGFRTYMPTIGRYTQGDPIGLDGGWNRFSYANNNALFYTDALGLQGEDYQLEPVPDTPALRAAAALLQQLADKAATNVDATCGLKCNLPWIRGTLVHSEFKRLVDTTCPASQYATEISYKDGGLVSYGTEGSSRADVVYGPLNAPTAVYDLKTGWAYMSIGQAKAYGANLPAGTPFTTIRPAGR